jgi:3-dehydrosphinganine reductase
LYDNRNVIITGGSSGLGRALARRLAGRGANLALIARDKSKLESTQRELSPLVGASRKVLVYSCDVSDPTQVEMTMARIADELGTPHLLINSAGILREGRLDCVETQVYREVMEINYFGTLYCIKAALPYFLAQGAGWIVNICSLGGRMGIYGYSAYSSSKFAVMGLTESLRTELKPQNIRVQVVCPSEFESPMVDELNKCRTRENRLLVHNIPVLDAETVADAVMVGMEKGRYMIMPGWVTRFFDFLNRTVSPLVRLTIDTELKMAQRFIKRAG